MARKQTDGEVIEGEGVLLPADALARAVVAAQKAESDMESGEDEIAAILARLGTDSKAHVRLYWELRGGKLDFIDKFSPQEWLALDVDGVKESYGGGDYRIVIYDANSKIRGRRSFSIARPRVSGAPAPSAPAPSAIASPEALAAAISTAVSQSIGGVLEKVLLASQNRGEFLRELVQYKTLFAPATPALPVPVAHQQGDPLDMLQKVLAISKDLKGSDGEKTVADVFLELVQQFGPVLSERMMQMRAAGGAAVAAPQARGIVPGPVPAPALGNPATPAAQPTANPGEDEMLLSLKYSVGFLVAQAETKKDPELYAEIVLDQLPADMIEKALTMPDADLLALLADLDPRVTQHADWFKELRQQMKLLTTEDEPGINSVPGGDDVT